MELVPVSETRSAEHDRLDAAYWQAERERALLSFARCNFVTRCIGCGRFVKRSDRWNQCPDCREWEGP